MFKSGAKFLGVMMLGGTLACCRAIAADPPAPANPTAPAATAQRATMLPPGSQIAADTDYYEQLNALNLSAEQVGAIAQQLNHLAQMDFAHTQRLETAVAPVSAQLGHVKNALLTDKTLASGDTTAIGAAEKPLISETVQLEKLRHDTADAIRQELSQSQIDAIRAFSGLQPDPTFRRGRGGPPNANRGAQPGQPGAAQPANAQPAGSQPAANAANLTPPGVALPAQIQPPPTPQDRMAQMFDHLRNEPADQFNRFSNREASRMTWRMGINRRDPAFATTRASLKDQFNQIRQLPAQQYQQGKTDLANGFIKQYPAITQNRGFGRGFRGAQNEADTEIIRRFFLVPDALVYFHARLMRGH
ncbi:MAG TPA: hypothetical protein VFJ58_21965 [Armatimonadota bacterium]|nr:hypothetical protein [Armatimonadota bacterium]